MAGTRTDARIHHKDTALILFVATSTIFITKHYCTGRSQIDDGGCEPSGNEDSKMQITSRRRGLSLFPLFFSPTNNIHKRYILPWFIDKMCSSPIVHQQRLKVVPLAEKNVLELGIGSGLNLPLYNPDKVTKIVGVDPDEYLWKKSEKRRLECKIPVERVGLVSRSGEERIPLPNDSFDCAVVTYTLCSIPNAVRALREVKRLLRPNGKIYFCEHGRAPKSDSRMIRLQNCIEPFSKWACGGCCPGKNIPLLFKEAGFAIEEMDQGYISSSPHPFLYNYWGTACVRDGIDPQT